MSTSSMTHQVRELVWGIQSEVAVVTSLCRRIDQHVAALNAAREVMRWRARSAGGGRGRYGRMTHSWFR